MTFYDRRGARYDPHKKRNTTVYTPAHISQKIHDHITPPIYDVVLDIGIGKGSLSYPFKDSAHTIVGIDPVPEDLPWAKVFESKYEDFPGVFNADLILCNPPFSGYGHNKLYPEVILRRITRSYPGTPLVYVCPCTMISNCTKTNKRWEFMQSLDLSAVGWLCRDAFETVETFAQVLFFNFPGIKPFVYL